MEKPIIFSTPMVQAILDDRKTMTRRVVRDLVGCYFGWGLDREPYIGNYEVFKKIESGRWGWATLENQWLYDLQTKVDGSITYLLKPPCQVGDVLWVRETWAPCATIDSWMDDKELFVYKADFQDKKVNWKWKPSIHMPKEVARIWLKVTDVRIEQLQDITENDAIKEGFTPVICTNCRGFGCSDCSGSGKQEPALLEFHHSWDGIYAKRGYGWDKNPWVWVIELERVRKDAKMDGD